MVYTAEKSLKDAGDKVPADVKTEVEEKIKAVKDAKDASIDDLKAKADALAESLQKIGSAMYKDQGAQGSNESSPNQAESEEPKESGASSEEPVKPAEGETVEGEVVEEKKEE